MQIALLSLVATLFLIVSLHLLAESGIKRDRAFMLGLGPEAERTDFRAGSVMLILTCAVLGFLVSEWFSGLGEAVFVLAVQVLYGRKFPAWYAEEAAMYHSVACEDGNGDEIVGWPSWVEISLVALVVPEVIAFGLSATS